MADVRPINGTETWVETVSGCFSSDIPARTIVKNEQCNESHVGHLYGQLHHLFLLHCSAGAPVSVNLSNRRIDSFFLPLTDL